MWRPPQRIVWKPDPGVWPGEEEAAASMLFSPIQIGQQHLEQRTWVPAMVPWRAQDEGFMTAEVLAWYRRLARGRPGALVVEATGIRDIPSGPLLRISHDRFIEGLAELTQTVREASDGRTRLFIQVIDFLTIRKRPEPEKYFERFLDITDRHREVLGAQDWPEDRVRRHLATLDAKVLADILSERELESLSMGYRERVNDTHLPPIHELPTVLPDLFAQAARRAREAGFDGVELHYAHAYTMASFLSRLNDRDDGYGGSRENRQRLPLEVFDRVRKMVGRDFVVGCRFLSEDCVAGGSELDDAIHFGVEFARAGMDYLSLSRGGRFEDAKQPRIGEAAYPYTGPSGYECMPAFLSDERGPYGRNAGPAGQIRGAVRAAGLATPVVVAGGIHGFRQAEQILQQGQADICGLARQSLADPDWFEKVRLGRGPEVRVCEYTNYCEVLDQRHTPVTCRLWDKMNLDAPDTTLTVDGKRRLTAPAWDSGTPPARGTAR